jgi:hypothetical protein
MSHLHWTLVGVAFSMACAMISPGEMALESAGREGIVTPLADDAEDELDQVGKNALDVGILVPTTSCSPIALAIALTWGRRYVEQRQLIFVVSKYDKPGPSCLWGEASFPASHDAKTRFSMVRFSSTGADIDVLFTKCPKGLSWVACSANEGLLYAGQQVSETGKDVAAPCTARLTSALCRVYSNGLLS